MAIIGKAFKNFKICTREGNNKLGINGHLLQKLIIYSITNTMLNVKLGNMDSDVTSYYSDSVY